MKGFVSLLKGRNFKNGKINNSSFLLKTTNEQKETANMQIDNYPKINKMIYSKMGQIKTQKKLNTFKNKKNKLNENYEDLFFHFLKTKEKIDIFESSSEKNNKNAKKKFLDININEGKFNEDEEITDISNNKEKKKTNIKMNQIFYHEIFLKLVNNKQKWNNFFFSYGVYKLMYQKSKIKKKEILKYSLKNNLNYEIIINSYDRQYTQSTFKHNWELNPNSAYTNYYKLYQKKNLSQSKEVNQNHLTDSNYGDVVVKVDNNSQERTLIYVGKLFNVYVEEYLKNKNNNIISMHTQELKPKKEIIYNSSDLMQRIKKDSKENFSFQKNQTYNKFEVKGKKYLNKKIKSNYLKMIMNNLGKKNKYFNNKAKTEDKRTNTESKKLKNQIKNKFCFSFNSIFNNNELFDRHKSKDKDYLSKIELYNKNLNKIQINKRLKNNQLSFSPDSNIPIIINYNLNNINNKKIDKPFYSKLVLKKKINEDNKKNNAILNAFKNFSDFYYL